jgi:hypothetical protein
MAGGMGFFGYALWHGLAHVTDGLVQVVVPGDAELSLKHQQLYTVFLESQSVVNGKIYSTNASVDGLECRVESAASEARIPIRRSVMSTTYEFGGRSGRSVLEFHVPADGSYGFSCSYGKTEHGPETVVAVGSGVAGRIMWTVFTGLLAMFGGFGSGLILFVATFVLRKNARSRLAVPNPAFTGQP